MGMYKKLADGTLQKLAGYTVIADGSCAEIRKGTYTLAGLASGGFTDWSVTFTDPMPDADYEVIISKEDIGYQHHAIVAKTTTGFTVRTDNQYGSTAPADHIEWTAFKLIPMEGYTELKNKVDNPDTTPTENSTNLCTSGGIYDFVKNASSIFVGTSTEWASATQTDYDIAVITDEHKILSIDKTAGTTAEQANLNKIFRGTLAEWEALSQAEKDYYDQAEIDDGPAVETSLLEKIYCVGSVYINTVDINPATIFGFGTWSHVSIGLTGVYSWERTA